MNLSNDTCTISFSFPDNVYGNVFASYAAPYNDKICIYGTNGQIEYDGKQIIYYGPRETYDKSGKFCKPNKLILHEFSNTTMWNESLFNSVDWFIKRVHRKK